MVDGADPVHVRARALCLTYRMGERTVDALNGVDLDVVRGEKLFVMGPSGSGKSSLLYLLGALERPTAGRVEVDGLALGEAGDEDLSMFRRRRVGFVFQAFNLVGTLSALDNVLVPVMPDMPKGATIARARQLLAEVGLADRVDHRPSQLSGGEQQRVAIARAFVTEPGLILADEPTGELDSETGSQVMGILEDFRRRRGTTVVIVTHDPGLVVDSSRVVRLRDGRIVG